MASTARISDLLARVRPGLTGSSEILVGPEHTAPFVGSGRIAVLATPVMINVIEAAALAAIEHLLPSGHQSLGIHLDVSHTAATPVGLRVTATAEVVRLEGRTVMFRVEARDDFESIGGGSHQRVIVSVARFDERVQRKMQRRADWGARRNNNTASSTKGISAGRKTSRRQTARRRQRGQRRHAGGECASSLQYSPA